MPNQAIAEQSGVTILRKLDPISGEVVAQNVRSDISLTSILTKLANLNVSLEEQALQLAEELYGNDKERRDALLLGVAWLAGTLMHEAHPKQLEDITVAEISVSGDGV